MNKYLVLEIKNLEPLKIGSRGVQNQIESSKSHIPGSTIRGAIIYYLIKQLKLNKDLHKDKKSYKKILLEDMKCYNAYPFYEDKLFYPNPIHLRTDKYEFRKASIEKNDNFSSFESLLDETEYINPLPLSYIALLEDEFKIKSIEIAKEFRLHHNKGMSKDNLFRYEAIKEGYTFRTIISADEEILVAIDESLENNNNWYLGGSKGSGYGLCSVRKISIENTYEESKKEMSMRFRYTEGKDLIITCVSDCILRDKYGNPCNHIPEDELIEILGKKNLKFERAIVNQGYSEGYNSTWGLRYPKESTVKAGSIMKYTCDKLSKNDIEKLEENLYGMRTTDGYGWIAANIKYPSEIDLNIIKNSEAPKHNTEITSNLDFNDKSLNIIIKGLDKAKEKWLRHIFIKEHKEGLIRIKDINSNGIYNMLKVLKEEIQASEVLLSRDYFKDRDKFSICNGITFINIYDYLEGKGEPCLDKYIDNKLGSTKGKLFYKQNDKGKKEFIKELTILALEVGGKYCE